MLKGIAASQGVAIAKVYKLQQPVLNIVKKDADPESELAKLKKALAAHQAMALVLGNGDYKGWFVLTDVQAISRHTDQWGTLVALEASITLREFVGDKKNPLPPPAMQPKLPPGTAKSLPASQTAGITTLANGATAVRDNIRQAVTYANQAQSALRVVTDAARMAQQLRNNPLAALGRVSSLVTGMKQVAGPLGKLSPSLAGLTGQFSEASTILRASSNALGLVHNAQGALSSVSAGTVVGRIDYLSGQLSGATSALNSAAPSISKLAGRVVTRAI